MDRETYEKLQAALSKKSEELQSEIPDDEGDGDEFGAIKSKLIEMDKSKQKEVSETIVLMVQALKISLPAKIIYLRNDAEYVSLNIKKSITGTTTGKVNRVQKYYSYDEVMDLYEKQLKPYHTPFPITIETPKPHRPGSGSVERY